MVLAAAGSCIYIRTRGGIVSRSQSQTDSVSNSYTYRTRNQKLVCQDKKNDKNKLRSCKETDRISADHSRACRMYAPPRHATPRPGPARPGQARRASARMWSSLSILNTTLRVVERTLYMKRSNSSSTSRVGLNLAPPLAILHMGFEISEIAMGLAH